MTLAPLWEDLLSRQPFLRGFQYAVSRYAAISRDFRDSMMDFVPPYTRNMLVQCAKAGMDYREILLGKLNYTGQAETFQGSQHQINCEHSVQQAITRGYLISSVHFVEETGITPFWRDYLRSRPEVDVTFNEGQLDSTEKLDRLHESFPGFAMPKHMDMLRACERAGFPVADLLLGSLWYPDTSLAEDKLNACYDAIQAAQDRFGVTIKAVGGLNLVDLDATIPPLIQAMHPSIEGFVIDLVGALDLEVVEQELQSARNIAQWSSTPFPGMCDLHRVMNIRNIYKFSHPHVCRY
jgi:hypothetical protein